MGSLKRRIGAIAAAVTPPPPKRIVKLYEPEEDAPPAEHAKYLREVQKAKRTADLVVVVGAGGRVRPEVENGVKVYPSELEATLAIFSETPSKAGRASLLHDVMDELTGKVMAVSDLPAHW